MKIELDEDDVWTLIEVLDAHSEGIEHLGDDEYMEKLNALKTKLQKGLRWYGLGHLKGGSK